MCVCRGVGAVWGVGVGEVSWGGWGCEWGVGWMRGCVGVGVYACGWVKSVCARRGRGVCVCDSQNGGTRITKHHATWERPSF